MSEKEGNKLINHRPLFEFALGVIAGISLCANLPRAWLVFAAFVPFLLGILAFALKMRRIAIVLLASAVGFTLASISLPLEFGEGKSSVSGVVSDIEIKDGKTVLTLMSVELNGEGFNKRAKLTCTSDAKFRIGDRIEAAEASVRAPSRRFGSYDEYRSMLSKGIGCIASADTVRFVSEHNIPLTELVLSIRDAVESRIASAFGDDAGLFSALLIGVRSELTDERAEAYRASGTAHLLAISGFHMGIIAGAVSILIPKRRRILKFIAVSLTAALYCTLAAYTAGIVRAAIMTACLLAANTLERRPDTLSALSLACILLLIFEPFQIYSVGFQLSFSAVFGIALFAPSLSRAFYRAKLGKKLSQSMAVCLGASIGTLMLQLRCYSSFTPYSVISNLIAVPVFSAVVILGLIVTLIAFVHPAFAAFIAVLPRTLLAAVERLLSLFADLPFSKLEFSPPSMISCVIFLFLLFAVSELVLRPPKKRLELAVPLMILFTFSYFMGIINA